MTTPDVLFGPLDWQGKHRVDDGAWRKAPYGITHSRALDHLERELEHLGATDVVIGVDVDRSAIRIDGRVRAGANPATPRVALVAVTPHGTLRFQAERWDSWRDNLRLIGLTLERLRLVDEGGVTTGGAQYQGFLAIGPGNTATRDAIAELAELADDDEVDADAIAAGNDRHVIAGTAVRLRRRALRRWHPDHGGTGDQDTLARIEAVAATLTDGA